MKKWEKRRRKQERWQDLRDADVAKRFPQAKELADKIDKPSSLPSSPVKTFQAMKIKPKTKNQLIYLESIRDHIITFCSGPSGAGKTILSCYMASQYLERGLFEKIVVVRPMVECGKTMGFQPGKEKDKLAPFVKVVLDKMGKFISSAEMSKMQDDGRLEIASINTMRGSEFNNSFVILDEAQNLTEPEMKMFLTRTGQNCKVVINGDMDQIDIYDPSGLSRAIKNIKPSFLIGFCQMDESDVQRSEVCRQILNEY